MTMMLRPLQCLRSRRHLRRRLRPRVPLWRLAREGEGEGGRGEVVDAPAATSCSS